MRWSTSRLVRVVAALAAAVGLMLLGTAVPAAAASTAATCSGGAADGAVHVVGAKPNWCLVVNGRPWTVKGMTWGPANDQLDTYWSQLQALGVNTIRTWGTDGSSKTLLDAAAKHGIRVISGFWLNHCADYVSDSTYKTNTLSSIASTASSYASNQGVLMWDVGNEVMNDVYGCGWSSDRIEQERNAYAAFVDQVAQKLHQVDPNHPVTSTDAFTGAWKYYAANAPHLDLYAVNTYGGVCNAYSDWSSGGYSVPFVVTETGPAGDWEVGNDANGVPDQATDPSAAKAYTNAWSCISAHPGVELGTTMFHFGVETDFAGIWFNVLPGGERRLSYYAVAKAYGGPAGAAAVNTPPTFSQMTVPTSSVKTGASFTIHAPATDPDGDALTYSVLFCGRYVSGGSSTLQQQSFTRSGSDFTVTAPTSAGVWKVYVQADDGHGNIGIETRSVKVTG